MSPEEAWDQVRSAEKALKDPSFAARLMLTLPQDRHREIMRVLAPIGRFAVDHVVNSENAVTVTWSHQSLGVVETTVIGTGPGFY